MFTTRDIGIAIRDFLEGKEITRFEGDHETDDRLDVLHIDVSDPNNPLIYMENGQRFTVSIVAGGGNET